VCLVVGDSLLVVDAAVQGDVDAECQESHPAILSPGAQAPDERWPASRRDGAALIPAG
jgi:hypothetical protein